MTPGNVTFWKLISNRGSHRKKKKKGFLWGRTCERKQKDRIESRRNTEESTWQSQIRLVLCWSLFISLNLFLFLGNPAWFYSLGPEPTTAMALLQKVQTLKAKAALSRLHRTACTFYFIFNLTGEIEFMMAESATWSSNNLGCLAITCPCKYASPVRIEQKISRLDKII